MSSQRLDYELGPCAQALQYLRKLCSHPLLVLDPSVPEHVAAVHAELGAGRLAVGAGQLERKRS